MREKMAVEWAVAETRAMLGVWGTADIQRQLDGVYIITFTFSRETSSFFAISALSVAARRLLVYDDPFSGYDAS